MRVFIVFAYMVLIMFGSTAYCRTIVVDNQASNASDENNGSNYLPLKTIQAGAIMARAGDTILVKGGIYREEVKPPRSGASKEKPITYLAAKGEDVSIRASEQITSWVKQEGNIWMVELDNSFFGEFNPYKEQVSGAWLYYSDDSHLGDVYLNGDFFIEKRSLQEVETTKNTWYTNVDNSKTRIWANFGSSNPNKELAEIHVRECVIFPELEGLKYIIIDGFDIRHSASNWAPPDAFQKGAVGPNFGYGWIIQNCTITDAKNVGICIGATKDHHWDDRNLPDINTFGHHIIRNNTIRRCGQGGIVGAYGCVRSIIEGNFIEDIAYREQYGGAEIGGIKLHFPIDVIIRNNHIRGIRTKQGGPGGIWLDWGSQNVRITGNIIYDCDSHPLKLEVNHGPIIVDNNIFIGSAINYWSDGTIFVHNLFCNTFVMYAKDDRSVPWYKPHSTVEAGRSVLRHRDDHWINNLFIGGTGLITVPEKRPGYLIDHNIYLDGALSHRIQDKARIVQRTPSDIRFEAKEKGVTLSFNLDKSIFDAEYPKITAKLIGELAVPKMTIQTPAGEPIDITADYYGNQIKASNVLPGPFQDITLGTNTFRLWPKEQGQQILDRYANDPYGHYSDNEKSVLTSGAKFIDIHVHADDCKNEGFTLDKVSEWMDNNSVERCIILPLLQTRPVNDEERKRMLDNYKKYKGKIYRYCVIFPDEVSTKEQAVEILKLEKQKGAIGFGEHYGRGLNFDDPKNMLLYDACQEVDLPMLFHMDGDNNKDTISLPHLENALKAYPNCIFIAHGPGWWKNIADGTCERLLQKYPNLYGELSAGSGARAISRDEKSGRKFLIRNADKLMFGTDSGPWSEGKEPAPQFSLFESLDLPAEVKAKIYRKNTEQLFKF